MQSNECFEIGCKVASIDQNLLNSDVGKVGMVAKSFKLVSACFKIVVQLGAIQFYLHLPLMCFILFSELKSIYVKIPTF